MSDEVELLKKWANGDLKSGDRLLQRYFTVLHHFLINKVPEDAVPDLIQETMLGCTESITKFRGDSTFKSYLLGIARNKLLHYYRRFGRKEGKLDPSSHAADDLIEGARVSSMFASRREQELLLQALRRIPVDHQIALELFYWEDLSAAECALVLETTEPRFKHGLRNARLTLADAITAGPGNVDEKRTLTEQFESWIVGIHQRIAQV